jgi:hypothetical protein
VLSESTEPAPDRGPALCTVSALIPQ